MARKQQEVRTPDQMAITGVPGVNPNGQITPFSPNPPWTTAGIFWLSGFQNDPSKPIEYFVDVFGALHVRGAVFINSTLSGNTYHPMFIIPLGYAFPSREHRYPTPIFGAGFSYPTYPPPSFSQNLIEITNIGGGPEFGLRVHYEVDVITDQPVIYMDGMCIQP